MTLFGFLLLSKEKQIDVALKSVFLDVRVRDAFVVLLFDMGGFYAEMYYASTPNQIIKFTAFKSTKLLTPYLREINVEDNGISLTNVFGENW